MQCGVEGNAQTLALAAGQEAAKRHRSAMTGQADMTAAMGLDMQPQSHPVGIERPVLGIAIRVHAAHPEPVSGNLYVLRQAAGPETQPDVNS